MSLYFSDIDHLMCRVDDAQAAGETFERLGFQVMPASALAGGALVNRCVLLKPLNEYACNYIELISVPDAGRCPPFIRKTLEPPERIAMIVGSSADARRGCAELEAAGLRGTPAMDFERDWVLANGEALRLAFTVSVLEEGQFPYHWGPCQHRTREHYVRSDLTSHPNTAQSLLMVNAIASDPAQMAARYGEWWKARVQRDDNGWWCVTPGDVSLRILSRAQAAELFARPFADRGENALLGFSISVADLGQAHRCLRASGLDFTTLPGRLTLGPESTHGLLIEMLEKR